MTIKEYQQLAKRTCVDINENNHLHMVLGVSTEVGELLDIFKKNIAYGKEPDLINLAEEVGDTFFYLVNQATFKGLVLEEIQPQSNKNFTIVETILRWEAKYKDYYFTEGDDEYLIRLIDMWAGIAELLEVDMSKCLTNNINKLKVRFPDHFSQKNALNRNLDNERKELEK